MGASDRILLVEDDAKLARLIQDYLAAQGFEVNVEADGGQAAHRITHETPSLVLLDLGLPNRDGLAICQDVRGSYLGPILILTARGDEADEVMSLEFGADDFVRKPVQPRVLLARVRALLRRHSATHNGATTIRSDALCIHLNKRLATIDEKPVDLTTAEYDLLVLLAERQGQVLSREEISTTLRGTSYDGLDRSIDLRISRLRRKLGDTGTPSRYIISVRGTGYMLAGGS